MVIIATRLLLRAQRGNRARWEVLLLALQFNASHKSIEGWYNHHGINDKCLITLRILSWMLSMQLKQKFRLPFFFPQVSENNVFMCFTTSNLSHKQPTETRGPSRDNKRQSYLANCIKAGSVSQHEASWHINQFHYTLSTIYDAAFMYMLNILIGISRFPNDNINAAQSQQEKCCKCGCNKKKTAHWSDYRGHEISKKWEILLAMWLWSRISSSRTDVCRIMGERRFQRAPKWNRKELVLSLSSVIQTCLYEH